jgi:hypothetical protein
VLGDRFASRMKLWATMYSFGQDDSIDPSVRPTAQRDAALMCTNCRRRWLFRRSAGPVNTTWSVGSGLKPSSGKAESQYHATSERVWHARVSLRDRRRTIELCRNEHAVALAGSPAATANRPTCLPDDDGWTSSSKGNGPSSGRCRTKPRHQALPMTMTTCRLGRKLVVVAMRLSHACPWPRDT